MVDTFPHSEPKVWSTRTLAAWTLSSKSIRAPAAYSSHLPVGRQPACRTAARRLRAHSRLTGPLKCCGCSGPVTAALLSVVPSAAPAMLQRQNFATAPAKAVIRHASAELNDDVGRTGEERAGNDICKASAAKQGRRDNRSTADASDAMRYVAFRQELLAPSPELASSSLCNSV